MPGLLKIGYTTRPVVERLHELNSDTGVPASFVVEAYFASERPEDDEMHLHRQLAQCRLGTKEFFEIDLDSALAATARICGRPPTYTFLRQDNPERFLNTTREADHLAAEGKANEALDILERYRIEYPNTRYSRQLDCRFAPLHLRAMLTDLDDAGNVGEYELAEQSLKAFLRRLPQPCGDPHVDARVEQCRNEATERLAQTEKAHLESNLRKYVSLPTGMKIE